MYILTLGVVETYRKLGVGSDYITQCTMIWIFIGSSPLFLCNFCFFAAKSLIKEVIKYASSIPVCRGVYLHVITHNNPAIRLYKRMSFRCVRRLHGFYLINGQHFDSYLFVYFVNGSRSPCSPL